MKNIFNLVLNFLFFLLLFTSCSKKTDDKIIEIQLSKEYLGMYNGIQPRYILKNQFGDDMLVNGIKFTVPTSDFKFILKENGKVSLQQTNLEDNGKTNYEGTTKIISEDSKEIKLECSLSDGKTSNPKYTLLINKSNKTAICTGTNEPKFKLDKTSDDGEGAFNQTIKNKKKRLETLINQVNNAYNKQNYDDALLLVKEFVLLEDINNLANSLVVSLNSKDVFTILDCLADEVNYFNENYVVDKDAILQDINRLFDYYNKINITLIGNPIVYDLGYGVKQVKHNIRYSVSRGNKKGKNVEVECIVSVKYINDELKIVAVSGGSQTTNY
ncbi:MAG: hypothetical protein EXR16_03160 [Bacteroidetes bacterium]|nr:hypothetical protein [Bacteroidota bacterium]